MQQVSLNDLSRFFYTAHWPETTERRPTFFSIAGFPHYENVISNVYQFFFRTNSPHGLKSLCIDALFDAIRIQRPDFHWNSKLFNEVHAIRELGVNNGQRLDILLHDGPDEDNWEEANTAVLIENKIYHWLANDLNNYWTSIVSEKICEQKKLAVVMGLHPERLPTPWIYVSHLQWAKAVEARLGNLLYQAEPRYVTLLLELIENIRTMTNADENFKEMLTFFQQNRAAISRAETIRNNVFMRFPASMKAILSEYEVWANIGANREGWLSIYRRGNRKFKYILYYYEVFHEDHITPSYAITLASEDEQGKEEELRQQLLKTSHAQNYGIKSDRSASYHVAQKIYQLTSSSYENLPELIASNLRNDWQPLEKHWINDSKQTVE